MSLVFLILLILTIIIHEVAHGYAALLLGDPTAKNEGRLTFNLLPHIDPLGTIIVPAILLLTNAGILFGWAKPVPYNPYNLKGKYSEAIVAAAGSAVNILIAVVFGLLYRFGIGILPEPILSLSAGIMYINLFLGLFNLIPIPPLDGSRIVLSLLPVPVRMKLEQQLTSFTSGKGIIMLIAVLLVLSLFAIDYLIMAVDALAALIVGQ